jgi:tetratricopeptide (TPR) repeat protein
MLNPMILARVVGRGFALLACLALAFAAADAGAKSGKKASSEPEERAVGLNRQVAEKLGKAIELFESDRFAEALAIVDELAKKSRLKPPDIAQIHRFRGYIYVSQGRSEDATQEFEKALAEHALDRFAEQQTTYSLAQLYTQLGNHDSALQLIEVWFAGAENPTPDAFFLKAMILVQQEKFEAALEPAQIAVGMTDTPRESWVGLLVAIGIQLQDYESVATNLERLIAIAPDKKQYWVQLAAVRNHLKQDAQALATLRLANQAGLLDDDGDYRQLARLLFVRELPFQCAQEMNRVIESGVVKADADSYRMLSNCYIAARELDLALEPLAKAGELAPDGEMYMLLGQMHLQRERFDAALAVLTKALAKAKPEQRGSVQLLIGVAQLGMEHFDAAETSFRAATSDAKVGAAARSYLKFVDEQRLRKEQLGQRRQSQTVAME